MHKPPISEFISLIPKPYNHHGVLPSLRGTLALRRVR